MLLNCGAGEDSWESLGLQRDPISQSSRKSVLNIHWKDWCWSWNSNTLATWCKELTHLKRPWCWERLKAGGEGDNRGWDGWVTSLIQWTCLSKLWVLVLDREAWRAAVHGVSESDTEWLNWTEYMEHERYKKIGGDLSFERVFSSPQNSANIQSEFKSRFFPVKLLDENVGWQIPWLLPCKPEQSSQLDVPRFLPDRNHEISVPLRVWSFVLQQWKMNAKESKTLMLSNYGAREDT